VVFEGTRLVYRAYNREINRVAHALHDLGISKGDKVATILPNCLELLETYWACAKIGAVVVPLSTLLEGKGLLSLLNDSDAKVVITYSGFVQTLEAIRSELHGIQEDGWIVIDEPESPGYVNFHVLKEGSSHMDPQGIEIQDEDPFNIIYSSGTTGLPKGIVHTHYIRAMYATLFASACRMTPESVALHAGSIVFNGAFVTLMPAVYLGATYVLMRQFEPSAFIEAVESERATHVMMVPSQIVAMLNAPDFAPERLASLEMILSLGAPLHREHKEALARQLPGRFYELYGLTEGFMTVLDKTEYPAKPDSVGVPPPFFEMMIVDDAGRELSPGEVGEIVGRGPILMPGYYKRPEQTREAVRDGWLYTGDLGYVDEEGFLYLVDRKKDMILSGGVNVYPRDIEEVVVQHPAVLEAAVFGIPHEKWGETPLAAVILRKPGSVSEGELKEWVNARVAAKYQRVHKVVIMEEFPRSAAGKTLKRVMREPYWAGKETRI
jgi:acyl-CoA synthetase (AMP-forming)/AMP-acid ligase II